MGFGIEGVKTPLTDLGLPGEYNWDGFFYPGFTIDPNEEMIVIFRAQLHPTGDLTLDRQVNEPAYQAIGD